MFMTMDIQMPLIFVSLFSIGSILLVLIYKFGIKEKSYEEALAEQRQQSNILLGTKPKLKEKKNKKVVKRNQIPKSGGNEIAIPAETVSDDIGEKNDDISKNTQHVEFKETPEEVITPPVPKVKKQPIIKKEKVKPILVSKSVQETDSTGVPPATSNHFEDLHPKDDFELFVKSGKATEEVEITSTQKQENIPVSKVPNEKQMNGFVVKSENIPKKKKKSDLHALQQLASDSNGLNMSVLRDLVRKADLSRNEVQILIDVLLNKQHEAPEILDEWSEGKSDPVQKLKKQLAEKEKLLAEEQQAVFSAQNKLKEIRVEMQSEKSVLIQKLKSLEEMLQVKQIEMKQKEQTVQKSQMQMQEEKVKQQQLREEIATQQQLHAQQLQQSDILLTQLQTKLQEQIATNGKLLMDLGRFEEEEKNERECSQNFMLQINTLQNELGQSVDLNRQLEECNIQLKHELDGLLKQEKAEISQLKVFIQQQSEQIRMLELYRDDMQNFKDESSKLISQLKLELCNAQEAKVTQLNGSTKQHEVEMLNLHNQLSSLQTQMSQNEKRYENDLKVANSLSEQLRLQVEELTKKLEEEKLNVLEEKHSNDELRKKNWKVMEALSSTEDKLKFKTNSQNKQKTDDEIQREFVRRLFPEIKDREVVDPELFKVKGEKFIKTYIDELISKNSEKVDQVSELEQLKTQAHHYKNVIDNTEKMLNTLQKHIEQEEIKWRTQLAARTSELESLKDDHKKLQEQFSSHSQEHGALNNSH